MSVLRCPSCGRAWDGAMCFACGHDGKSTAPSRGADVVTAPSAQPSSGNFPKPTIVPPSAPLGSLPAPFAGSPPLPAPSPFPASPTPNPAAPSYASYAPSYSTGAPPPSLPPLGRTGTPGPMFAPLPPLPPLPSGMGGGIPPISTALPPQGLGPARGAAVPPTTALGFQGGLPSFTPAGGVPAGGVNQAPPSALPPIVARASQPAASPPPPPLGSFNATPRTRPEAQATASPAAAFSMTGASAPGLQDEATQDVDRPSRRHAPPGVRQLVRGPAAFPLVFVVGFLVSFVPAALVLWRTAGVAELYEQGRFDEAAALVEQRLAEGAQLPAEELVIAGHSLKRINEPEQMMDKYQLAKGPRLFADDLALKNVLDALADDRAGAKAALLLGDWKANKVDGLLNPQLSDENARLRHNALAAITVRTKDPMGQAQARLAVARADLKEAGDCLVVKQGLDTIRYDIAANAPQILKTTLADEIDGARVYLTRGFTCYSTADVKNTMQAIAASIKAYESKQR